MNVLSAAYGGVARLRRVWYERRPHLRRRLDRPVVSVGNLVVGGSGKTPIVAAIARILLAAGERPAVLTRGYGRRDPAEGVVVVSDGATVLETVDRAGDEPLMLARMLPGVAVLVCADRYLAGRMAERVFGSTVLLLDDGFQHLQLERDVDLLAVHPADLEETPLPTGRLREPLDVARACDAVLVDGDATDASDVGLRLDVSQTFTFTRHFSPLGLIGGAGTGELRQDVRVTAVAGIARPTRFFASLRSLGWNVAHEIVFADHHAYTEADVRRVEETARKAESSVVITTEKDAVRLEPVLNAMLMPSRGSATWAFLPMHLAIEPAEAFAAWLVRSVRREKSGE